MVELIDARIEKPVRELFHHALQDDVDEFGRVLQTAIVDDEELHIRVMTLVARVATVAVFQRCDNKKPTDEDLAGISAAIIQNYSGSYPLEYDDALGYLGRVLFAGELPDEVLGIDKAVLVPLVVTANLIAWGSQFEEVETWTEYLDALETGLEESGNTSYLTAQDVDSSADRR